MSGDVDGVGPPDGSEALPASGEYGPRSHPASESEWEPIRRSDDPLLSVRNLHTRFDTDEAVIDALYEEHVAEGGITGDGSVRVPGPVEERITEVRSLLVDGDRASAVAALDESFSTVCEEHHPAALTVGAARNVDWHPYVDGISGEREPKRRRPER